MAGGGIARDLDDVRSGARGYTSRLVASESAAAMRLPSAGSSGLVQAAQDAAARGIYI